MEERPDHTSARRMDSPHIREMSPFSPADRRFFGASASGTAVEGGVGGEDVRVLQMVETCVSWGFCGLGWIWAVTPGFSGFRANAHPQSTVHDTASIPPHIEHGERHPNVKMLLGQGPNEHIRRVFNQNLFSILQLRCVIDITPR